MYTGTLCVALGHNLVGLWLLNLHWGFLLLIRGYEGGHVGGLCVVVCIADLCCILWLWFPAVHGVSFYFGLCFKLFV